MTIPDSIGATKSLWWKGRSRYIGLAGASAQMEIVISYVALLIFD